MKRAEAVLLFLADTPAALVAKGAGVSACTVITWTWRLVESLPGYDIQETILVLREMGIGRAKGARIMYRKLADRVPVSDIEKALDKLDP